MHGPRTDEERIVNGPFRSVSLNGNDRGFLAHTVHACLKIQWHMGRYTIGAKGILSTYT